MEVCRVLEEKGYGVKRDMLRALCGVLYMGEELCCSDVGLYNERLKECKSELNKLSGEGLSGGSGRLEEVGSAKLEEVGSAKLEEVGSAKLEERLGLR